MRKGRVPLKSAVIGQLLPPESSLPRATEARAAPVLAERMTARRAVPGAPALVVREALLTRLEHAASARLVALVAPAGSGKSTLLAQWQSVVSGRRPVACLSLSDDTREPAGFFLALHRALRAALPGASSAAANTCDMPCACPAGLPEAVDWLAALVGTAAQAVTVVLDGFDAVDDPLLLRMVDHLVQHGPQQVRWMVASRRMPGFPISRMQLQDQCVLIGANDLAFSAAEIGELGVRLTGQTWSDADIAFILKATDGWCGGVKFAIQSTDKAGAEGEPLAAFNGSHQRVAQYFADEVFDGQPGEVRRFLTATSIVDRMSGALCNALLGISHGDALLERMVRAQLFVQPLDNHRRWYRYNPLFLDYLRDRLQRENAEMIARLHLAASRWFDAEGLPQDALPHAFAAQHRPWCLQVMERCAVAWTNDGLPLEVLRWCAELTQDEILAHGDICCAYILSLMMSHRMTEACAVLRLATERAERVDGGAPSPASEVDRYRLRVLGRLINGEPFGEQEADVIGPRGEGKPEEFFAGILVVARTSTLLRCNQFDAARRMAMRAREIGQRCASAYLVSHAETLICAADFQQGNLKSAALACERNYAALRSGPRSPAWVNAAVTLACLRYERGRLADARALLAEVLPHVTLTSTLWVFSAAYIVLARLKALEHKPAEAVQLLDYAHSVLEDAGHPRYLAEICFEKVRLNLDQNDLARAAATADEFSLVDRARHGEWWSVRRYDESWGRYGFATALLSMQQGDCEAARTMLEVLRESAEDAGRVARRASFDMALAMCHWQAGHEKTAFEVLNQTLSPSQQLSFSRTIFDEVPRFSTFLRAAINSGKLRHIPRSRHFNEWLGLVPGASGSLASGGAPGRIMARPLPVAAVVPAREPLTERELEILGLLAKGLCNKAISRCSGITLNTIKWHLRNVFTKLDASNRTGAVARGRELRLIE